MRPKTEMVMLSSDIISSFNSALKKLTGSARRQYAAELCEAYFDNSARKIERALKVSRRMVELGQHERRSGVRCIDCYSLRGRKKKKIFILL